MPTPTLWPPGSASGAPALLADYRDWDGVRQAVAVTTSGWAAAGRGAVLLPAGQQTWWNLSGGVGTDTDYMDVAGPCHRMIPAAGAGVSVVRGANPWDFPLWQDITLWPAAYRTRRRFTVSAIIEMVTLPTNAGYFFGLHNGGGLLDVGGAGQSGVELLFNIAPPGWVVRSRLTPLGGTTVGASSGIGLATRCKAAFRYTEGAAPTLDVLVNDVVLQTFTGVAQLPEPGVLPLAPAGGLGGFQPLIGGGCNGATVTVADGDFRIRNARYTIEELIP